MGDVLVPFVNCVVVLTGDGQRVLAKYYDKRSDEEQVKAESTFHKVRAFLCPSHPLYHPHKHS